MQFRQNRELSMFKKEIEKFASHTWGYASWQRIGWK
jgi:hypothetical protein